MAQKDKHKQQQRSPLDEPPTASSSSSEEEDQHPENEEVSSEEDLPPVPPTNSHPQPPPSKFETDSGSGSGSESESEPNLTPAKVKPQPLASKSASKRPAENAAAADPKRAKKKSSSNPSSSTANKEDGNKSHNKLWSEQDELAILKGALDFTSKTGQDPFKTMFANAFLDFIKKSLHVEVSPSQLKDKLKKLKIKFRTNAAKGENGEGPTFLKPHDRKVFQLSKKVWGNEIGAGANGSAAQNTKKKETQTQARSSNVASEKMQIVPKADSGSESLLLSSYKAGVKMNENDLKRAVELIGESKRAELEGRWKKLQLAEMELLANRSKLIADQTRLILEVLKDE